MTVSTQHTKLPAYIDEGTDTLRRIRKLAESHVRDPRPLDLRWEYEARGIRTTNAAINAFFTIRHSNLDLNPVSSARVEQAYNQLLPHVKSLIADWHNTIEP